MATAAQQNKDFSQELNAFRTVNTKDSPVTMKDDELPILMNLMPIGTSLYSIPGYSASPLVTIGDQEAAWTANTAMTTGVHVVRPTVKNGFIYLATTGGTTHATTEPTWPTANGTTVVDNTVTWTAYDLTVKRFADVNLNNVIYKLVATVGGALYLVNASWVQVRLGVPGVFTDPQFEQWKYSNALIISPVAGYYDHDGIPGADRDAGLTLTGAGSKTVKTSNVIAFVAGTTQAYKAATNDLWDLTGFNVADGFSRSCYLYLSTTGVASIATGGTGATTLAGADALLPAKDTTKALIGRLNVTTVGAGFVGGTTALDAATVTDTYTANIMLLHHTTLSAPAAGTCIAVWKGRVWVGNGRTIFLSAPDSFTDWQTASSGGSVIDSYPSLRNLVVALVAAQDYLYVVGDHATHAISGIQIFAGTSTIFNLTDALPGIGSPFPDSVKALGAYIFETGDIGINAVAGGSFEPLSSYLDGMFPGIDTTFKPVAFFAKIFNKLCYAVLVHAAHPVDSSLQKIILCYYEGRWFYVLYGLDLLFVAQSASTTDTKSYAAYGNNIIEIFNGESVLTKKVRTKALNFGAPFNDKQILNIGATLVNSVGLVDDIVATMTVLGSGIFAESSQASSPVTFNPDVLTWVNSYGVIMPWQLTETDTTPMVWIAIYNDMLGMSQIEGRGKRVQLDFEETSVAQYVITGLMVSGQYGASN